jgi:hypothetical protein
VIKIELHAKKYVIRRGSYYFLCFVGDDGVEWISTPYLARHFAVKEDVESALVEIRKRRRKAKGEPCQTM